MILESAKMIGAGIAAIGMIGAGIGIGLIFAAMVNSIARYPENKKDITSSALLGFALTETVALLVVLIGFLILFM